MRLHLHEWGDATAPPLVCLHGISGHAGHFDKLASERWSARFRVVAPDLRGHGGSSHEPPWDLATHLADVLETVGAAGIDHATWVGLSFGGRLVLEIAAQQPSLVERAILLDPAIQILPHVGLDMAEQTWRESSFASIEDAIESRLAAGPMTPPEFVEADRRAQLVQGRDGLFRFRFCVSAVVTGYGELCTNPPTPDTLRAPTLLVYAPAFGLVRDDQVEAYRSALGDRLEVAAVPGGHMVIWDAHEETAAAVDRFLERGAGRA